jgi:IS5 family transposase
MIDARHDMDGAGACCRNAGGSQREAAMLADKACQWMERREALAEIGITGRIMHRRHQAKRQPAWHKWMNLAITPLRGQIQKIFGTMKRRYLYRRVRYRSLEHNRCQRWLLCTAMNLRRADQLTG